MNGLDTQTCDDIHSVHDSADSFLCLETGTPCTHKQPAENSNVIEAFSSRGVAVFAMDKMGRKRMTILIKSPTTSRMRYDRIWLPHVPMMLVS